MSLKITGILLIILILCNIEAYAYREKSKLRVPMAFEGKAGMRQGEIATLREYLKEAYKLEIKPGITLLGLIENLEKAKKLYAEALEILRPGDSLVIKIQGKIAYLNRSIKMLWGKARLEETAMASFRADVERIKVLSGQSQREDAYDPEFLYGYEVGMNNKEPADDGGGLRAKIRLLLKAGWKKRT
ncbi:MAG: hypothetical protein Q8N76_08510, partial [Candidatus Omnitrophota bacterium]|nr:hypothetical protein [Candidatus Omnitrophota bacterium]